MYDGNHRVAVMGLGFHSWEVIVMGGNHGVAVTGGSYMVAVMGWQRGNIHEVAIMV